MAEFVTIPDVLTSLRRDPESFSEDFSTHPGLILKEDWLDALGVTVYAAAKAMKVPATRLDQITKGRRTITADTALRLGLFFGVTAEFWLNLQRDYDLHRALCDNGRALQAEVEPLGKAVEVRRTSAA